MSERTARRQRVLQRKRRKRKQARKRRPDPRGAADRFVGRMRRAAEWPLHRCLVTDNWRDQPPGLVQVVITRLRPVDGVALATFLVDLGCLGVKDAFAHDDLSVRDYHELVDHIGQRWTLREHDPAFAVKLVQTGVDYAASLGFRPAPEYRYAREMFGDIDPDQCDEEIVCGFEGKPFFIAGPHDRLDAIYDQLTARLGENGFYFAAPFW